MQFLTLRYVDPATYQIMGNLKIVTTGVLFRLFLRRRLSPLQWIALTLLMIGAATSQARFDQTLRCQTSYCLHRLVQVLTGSVPSCGMPADLPFPVRCADQHQCYSHVDLSSAAPGALQRLLWAGIRFLFDCL